MKLFMFAGLRHHDVEPWPLYTSHRDILQPCVGTVHVSIWGWLEMRPNASRPPRREKTRSVWSNRNSFIWNETFAEPQDKGEQDSFHLKAPIKIQHIHSSTKPSVMASTCWGDLWGCSEGIAEETINWKVRGAPSDSDNWRVHDRIPGNAHSPVWCLVELANQPKAGLPCVKTADLVRLARGSSPSSSPVCERHGLELMPVCWLCPLSQHWERWLGRGWEWSGGARRTRLHLIASLQALSLTWLQRTDELRQWTRAHNRKKWILITAFSGGRWSWLEPAEAVAEPGGG